MFIAMNRFRIHHGFEPEFERIWRERESSLPERDGFLSFHLLKGADDGECAVYASHTMWQSRADFDAWRESEQFHRAHVQAKAPQGTYAGHPVFEGFDVILAEGRDSN